MAGWWNKRIRKYYKKYFPVGDRLGEMFYAVWMVVVSLGVINSTGNPEELVLYAIVVALLVNVTWGLIDGLTVMHTNVIEKAKDDQLVYDLRTKGDKGSRDAALDVLGDTITADLSKEEKDRIIDAIAKGEPGENPYKKPYYPHKEDWYYALGIIGIDAFFVLPLILPLVFLGDTTQAVYFSRLIATVFFMILGAAYAKNLNRRRWLAALFLGVLGFSIFSLSYGAGW